MYLEICMYDIYYIGIFLQHKYGSYILKRLLEVNEVAYGLT